MADPIIFTATGDITFFNTADIHWSGSAIVVYTAPASSVEDTSMVGNGYIYDLGGDTITETGFCYIQNTTGDPTTADDHVYSTGAFDLGAFDELISSLTTGKNYRVRAYAVGTTSGTIYGDTVSVITDLDLADTIVMSDAISQKNAVSVRSDTVTLAGIISQRNAVFAHSDIILLSDAVSQKADSIVFTNTIDVIFFNTADIHWSGTDIVVLNVIKGLADTAIFSDTITEHNVGLGLADTVIFTENIAKILSTTQQDTVTLSDAITEKNFVVGLSDIVTLVDVPWKHLTFGTAFTDAFTVVETISKEPGLFPSDEYEYADLITIMKLDGSVPYIKPENTVFSEGRIKSVYGMEPSNFYEIDEQGEDE